MQFRRCAVSRETMDLLCCLICCLNLLSNPHGLLRFPHAVRAVLLPMRGTIIWCILWSTPNGWHKCINIGWSYDEAIRFYCLVMIYWFSLVFIEFLHSSCVTCKWCSCYKDVLQCNVTFVISTPRFDKLDILIITMHYVSLESEWMGQTAPLRGWVSEIECMSVCFEILWLCLIVLFEYVR